MDQMRDTHMEQETIYIHTANEHTKNEVCNQFQRTPYLYVQADIITSDVSM